MKIVQVAEMKKGLNCWNFMQCGFGPDGSKAKADGVCPAALAVSMEYTAATKAAGLAGWSIILVIVEQVARVIRPANIPFA